MATTLILASVLTLIFHDFFWRYRQRLDLISMLPRQRGSIVLTFDDGPDSFAKNWGDYPEDIIQARERIKAIDPGWDFHASITQNLARTLEEFDVQAMFFVQGQILDKDSSTHATLMDLVQHGHTLGNHFFSHTRCEQQTAEATEKEIKTTHALIKRITNQQTCVYRPPHGQWSILRSIRLRLHRNLNNYFLPLQWTHDSLDFEKPIRTLTLSQLEAHVDAMLNDINNHPGLAIILQHDVWAYSALFTRRLLQRLQRQASLAVVNPSVVLQSNATSKQGFWWAKLIWIYFKQRSHYLCQIAHKCIENPNTRQGSGS
jgi:peptidoglycan/xylan/chitin deacetylase (PgdA/CDA1 family)